MNKNMTLQVMVDRKFMVQFSTGVYMVPNSYKKALGLVFLLFSAGFAVWYPLANLL